MMLSKKQTALYEAVSNIGSHYIEETITAPVRFTPAARKRIAAAAAMLALVLGVIGVFPKSDAHLEPLFAVRASANYGSDTTIEISGGAVAPDSPFLSTHPKDSLKADWQDKDLFSLRIFMNDCSAEDYDNTVVVIEYAGQCVELDSDDPQIDIQRSGSRPAEPSRQLLYTVYGWFDETTKITVNFYTQTPEGLIPLHKQTVIVGYDNGYSINGANSAKIDLSTAALLEQMLGKAEYADWLVASNLNLPWESWMQECEDELIELRHREDAIRIMLDKLAALDALMQDPDITADQQESRFSIMLVSFLLSMDAFNSQMAAEDLTFYNSIIDTYFPGMPD